MPAKSTTKHIAVYMSNQAIDVVKAIAQRKGYKAVGEYIRDLIKRDVEHEEGEIDFGLDEWGGKGRKISVYDEK